MSELGKINSIWDIDIDCEHVLSLIESFLTQGGNPNEFKYINDRTALAFIQQATRKGKVEIVKLLVQFGANPDLRENKLAGVGSALLIASGSGYAEICEILIEHGADVDMPSYGTYLPGTLDMAYPATCPLHRAAEKGHDVVVRLLLEGKANPQVLVNPSNLEGYVEPLPPLMYLLPVPNLDSPITAAARRGHFESVKALIEGGADINFMHQNGFSALHESIINNHLDIFYLLVENDADIHRRGGFNGATPLWFAQDIGHKRLSEENSEIQAYLEEQGGTSSQYWWAEILKFSGIIVLIISITMMFLSSTL